MNKVIICGFGHVGYQIFALVNRLKISGTIITNETKSNRINEAIAAGFEVILGDASDCSTLEKAGAAKCSVLFAVTDSDLTNLSVLSDAQKLNSSARLIVRLFDRLLSEQLLKTKLAHAVLSTTEIAAPLFLRRIFDTSSHNILAVTGYEDRILIVKDSGNHDLQLELHDPPPPLRKNRAGGFLRVLAKGMLKARSFSLMLCLLTIFGMFLGVVHLKLGMVDSFYFFVSTVTTTGYGDINFLNASPAAKLLGSLLMLWGAMTLAILFSLFTDILLKYRLQGFVPALFSAERNHIILIGVNRLSQRLHSTLKGLGVPSVVINPLNDPSGEQARSHNASTIEGNPCDPRLFESLNIQQGRGVISCTGDDVINLGSCILAKKLNPKILTISRIHDAFLAQKLQSTLGIDDVGSVSTYSAAYFVANAIRPDVVAAFEKNGQLKVIRSLPAASESIASPVAAAESRNISVGNVNFILEAFRLT